MRQVFRSQRLENVEAAADLLRKQGIEVKISNGRSWRGHRRGNFSYDLRKARDPDALPTLWIINADDQPRARQLLRDLGLLESTRDGNADALSNTRFEFAPGSGANSPARKRWRIGVLAMIAIVIALIVFLPRHRPASSAAPTAARAHAAPPPVVPEAITETAIFRLDVPKALAVKLIATVAASQGARTSCVRVDGRDPAPEIVSQAAAAGVTVQPASACSDPNALRVEIDNYLTDGSGEGEVQLKIGAAAAQGFRARRDGVHWSVQPTH
ncbi:hypothetical protein [Thermomonas sp.]|uniref:hypothetical protein n=1 Tax=Thermomonas sp. TaxID=1971895 RepID=UPI002621A4E3|nr:hypothetical protein [Thermomonas sp.]MCO5054937.1 hypothetical protein [Thermomonas sp.]